MAARSNNIGRPVLPAPRLGYTRDGYVRHGFTLVEMLVVIGIILLLLGILLPAVNVAYRNAVRTRMAADLQAIGTALEAYKSDFGEYPPVNVAGEGATTLCKALIAPQDKTKDGHDGPGFQLRPASLGTFKVYGPYLPVDKFRVTASTDTPEILDRYKKPILYYPANRTANISAANGYVAAGTYGPGGTKPMFNANDNATGAVSVPMPVATLQRLMGDANANGMIDAGESPAFTGAYLLWSAGPDEAFGPTTDPNGVVSTKNRCDDVANFPRSEY